MKAIGFDLGETLIAYKGMKLSWRDHYLKVLKEIAKACKLTPSLSELTLASSCLGKFNTRENPRIDEITCDKIFKEVLSCWGTDSSALINKACKTFFSFFQNMSEPYEDTLSSLAELKKRNVKIGILTDVPYGMSKEFAIEDVRLFQPFVDVFLTSVDVGKRKPDVAGYEMLMEQLKVKRSEIAYVGNERKDIEGARSAGIKSILIARNGMERDWKQDSTIFDLSKLLTLYF